MVSARQKKNTNYSFGIIVRIRDHPIFAACPNLAGKLPHKQIYPHLSWLYFLESARLPIRSFFFLHAAAQVVNEGCDLGIAKCKVVWHQHFKKKGLNTMGVTALMIGDGSNICTLLPLNKF